jgi:flagellar hook-associated protein 3 FlgL
MRVTNGTLLRNFLNDMHSNLQNMSKYEEQLSTGQEYKRPSDNPFGVVKSIGLNSSITRNNQYLSNIQDSTDWLNTTDTAVGQINDSLQRVRELLVASANGTNTQDELNANKAEITQKIQEIVQIGNSSFDGRYIFGGTATTNPPFTANPDGSLSFAGNGNNINREISPNVALSINVSGQQVLTGNASSPVDLSTTLKGIITALSTGDHASMSGNLLGAVQDNINNLLRLRAEVGAKQNRMDSAQAKNEEETSNLTEILTKTSDIDIAEKTIQFKTAESVYQASLMTGAKIIQPSLLDFLR